MLLFNDIPGGGAMPGIERVSCGKRRPGVSLCDYSLIASLGAAKRIRQNDHSKNNNLRPWRKNCLSRLTSRARDASGVLADGGALAP